MKKLQTKHKDGDCCQCNERTRIGNNVSSTMNTKKRKFLFFLVVFSLIPLYRVIWAEIDPGVQLFNERKFSEAKSYFEKAFREDPTNGTAAFYLGRIEFINDEYNKALEWLEKSVQLDQERSEYSRWLGRAYGYKTRTAIFFKQPSLAKNSRIMARALLV